MLFCGGGGQHCCVIGVDCRVVDLSTPYCLGISLSLLCILSLRLARWRSLSAHVILAHLSGSTQSAPPRLPFCVVVLFAQWVILCQPVFSWLVPLPWSL